ncbi:hypothetical protein, partial [Salmonella sp. SAL4450]|uniref:hypothetical protein n=1 Tax=Salmonella sp. SAL4450 TaxID=3159905 RepID=UPI003978A921
MTCAVGNLGAGHFVPTGLPERRVVLTVRAIDETGAERRVFEQVFGRILVDDRGAPAPFYRAERVASDNRIGPERTST